MKSTLCISALFVVTAISSPGQTLTFVATGPVASGISPLNENPPHPTSSATGSGLVTWNTVTNTMTMTVNVVFTGLSSNDTAAHIHCCVAPNGNAGVATTVPTFTGFPLGVTSGTYAHTFNMLDPASYNPAYIAANGGTAASAAAALLAGIQAGHSYLNIHSMNFPGGEMRGFLVTQVIISIKPGSSAPAPVNPKSHGTTPVAILSSATFNAPATVDTTSLTFGKTGDEQSLAFCNTGGEDVDGDGLLDLVCHFNTQALGFQSGDTMGILKGKTLTGSPITDQEGIVIRP